MPETSSGRFGKVVKDPNNNYSDEAGWRTPGSTSLSLVHGVRTHDPEAWRRLAALYGPLVYRWCRQHGLPPPDAEDVVQEVFLTVAVRAGDFRRERTGDTFRGWLRTITRHKLGDWIRGRRTREHAVGGEGHRRLLENSAAEGAQADDEAEAGDLYRRALDLIRSEFEERSWQAFWRVAVEGQCPADVAADLGISRNAVYVAKSRIFHRLFEVLGDR
jgi:RNA polymerase sigma-70 factor (ECF subfamily)